MEEEKICAYCGRPFRPFNRRSRFCCGPCRRSNQDSDRRKGRAEAHALRRRAYKGFSPLWGPIPFPVLENALADGLPQKEEDAVQE